MKIITTNIITGEQTIHGPYITFQEASDVLDKKFSGACCFHFIFDETTGAEIVLMSPHSSNTSTKERQALLKQHLIKPCPSCGAKEWDDVILFDRGDYAFYGCMRCDFDGPAVDTADKAKHTWNDIERKQQ